MRVAVYGGSFNPPHVGHAMVAAWLGWTDQVDEVWLLPTYAHAFGKDLLPFPRRLQLCGALASAVGPWVRVSDVEQTLDGVSYTVDTLRHLADAHPDRTFRLCVGSDVLPETPRWKEWSAIEAEFDPIVVGRAGYAEVEGAPSFPGVSSTAVRRTLASGGSVEGLVPAAVRRLIQPGDYY